MRTLVNKSYNSGPIKELSSNYFRLLYAGRPQFSALYHSTIRVPVA
jgi:hypothetical protein